MQFGMDAFLWHVVAGMVELFARLLDPPLVCEFLPHEGDLIAVLSWAHVSEGFLSLPCLAVS